MNLTIYTNKKSCPAQPNLSGGRTQFKQRFGPTQFSRPGGLSIVLRSTSTCRVFSKRKEKKRKTPPVAVVLLLPRSVLSPAGRLLMASPPPVAADGHHSVFVYGTLMAEEVVRVLLGRAPPSSPALLPDHRRFSIRGRVYPAILPARGHAVSGKVRVRLSLSTRQP